MDSRYGYSSLSKNSSLVSHPNISSTTKKKKNTGILDLTFSGVKIRHVPKRRPHAARLDRKMKFKFKIKTRSFKKEIQSKQAEEMDIRWIFSLLWMWMSIQSKF
jgi:hypothetical protein